MDANAWKAKGNEAFSAKDFPNAITAFGEAIKLDAANHVLYSNRSAAYASLKDYKHALVDAEKCVSLNGGWAKGYLRLGSALHGLHQFKDSIQAFEKGLVLEPTNASIQEALAAVRADQTRAEQAVPNPFGKVFNKDCIGKIQSNPKIAPYMMQPDFVQTLSKIIDDPSLVQMFMKDKRVMHVFMELSGISLPNGMDDDDDDNPAPAPKPAAPKKEAAKAAPAAPVGNPEALKLKEEGNEFYKQRKFDEALEKYEAAIALDPSNTTFHLNRTAVFFEKGEFARCAAECESALEHGREHKADYQQMARLMTRQALCVQRQGQYDEAITLYKRALLEHRNADTLAKLTACEKEKKEAEVKAYLNPEIAAAKKEEGNAFFKSDEFPKAVECYTESIKRNPNEHTTYSNRAACYLKLGAHSDAVADCDKCLALKPDFVKAYARKGHAFFWTKQYNKALQAYEAGMKIDATNAECKEGHTKTLMKIQEVAGGDGDEDVAQRAMSDPEIQAIMGDTYMQLVLSEMQKNPARINEYMQNPDIAAKINKLIAAGIIRVGSGPNGGGAAAGRR